MFLCAVKRHVKSVRLWKTQPLCYIVKEHICGFLFDKKAGKGEKFSTLHQKDNNRVIKEKGRENSYENNDRKK